MEKRIAYKLLRLRKDGTLSPLFINRKQIIPLNIWLKAESHPTSRFAFRPGWHVTPKPIAPHLSIKGRVWMLVEVYDCEDINRPESQGGTWWLAKNIKVLRQLTEEEMKNAINYETVQNSKVQKNIQKTPCNSKRGMIR